MKLSSLVILLLSITLYSQSNIDDEEMEKVISEIPDGWRVCRDDDTLTFERIESVYSLYENKINAPISIETPDERFERIKTHGTEIKAFIKLIVFPRWTAEQFANANTHNNKIQSQIFALEEEYDVVRLRHESQKSIGGYYFIPETGDDEDRIRMFQLKKRELERELINIPDYHSEKFSFFVSEIQGAENEFVSILPQIASDEVYSILSLFQQHLFTYR